MKILFGAVRIETREIYAIYPTEPIDIPFVRLVENYTMEDSDYTDTSTGINYITTEHLGSAFNELCANTRIKKCELAKMCQKNAATFSRYCSGATPVPKLVWKEVERIVKKIGM